jgi:xanthine dehydrogenase accessory factor
MSAELFEALPGLLARHGRVVMATLVAAIGSTPRETAARMLFLPDGSTRFTIGGGKFESLVTADAKRLLAEGGLPFTRNYNFVPTGDDSFGAVCGGKLTVLLEVLERAPRLLVVGAGHCGRALARAAQFTGFAVTVVDERPEQLEREAFPAAVHLMRVAPDYSDIPRPGPEDSVAIVSRGHVTDGLALRSLRGVPMSYIGMIGSNAKRKALFSELMSEGFTSEELARVRIPIGLAIGARTPEEIAIAIVAELIATRRGVKPG